MQKALSIMGLVVLWGLIVVIFLMAEEILVEQQSGRGDAASFENYIVRTFKDLQAQKKLCSAGFVLIQGGKLMAEHGLGIANLETQTHVKPNQTLYLLSSL